MRILIAEDSDLYRQMYITWFNEWNYAFDIANDGSEALSFVQKRPYDLIITDVEMPKLDGVGLLNALKEQNISVPVLVVSGTNREVILDCLKIGAVDYLLKPFNSVILQAKILKLLTRSRCL